MAVFVVVGLCHAVFAIYFQAQAARLTVAAGVYNCSNSDHIADLESSYILSHTGDTTDDLVPWDHRIGAEAPFVASLMNIGMTNAAVKDVYHNIVRAGFAT